MVILVRLGSGSLWASRTTAYSCPCDHCKPEIPRHSWLVLPTSLTGPVIHQPQAAGQRDPAPTSSLPGASRGQAHGFIQAKALLCIRVNLLSLLSLLSTGAQAGLQGHLLRFLPWAVRSRSWTRFQCSPLVLKDSGPQPLCVGVGDAAVAWAPCAYTRQLRPHGRTPVKCRPGSRNPSCLPSP